MYCVPRLDNNFLATLQLYIYWSDWVPFFLNVALFIDDKSESFFKVMLVVMLGFFVASFNPLVDNVAICQESFFKINS